MKNKTKLTGIRSLGRGDGLIWMFLASTICSCSAVAATKNWTGSTDSNWANSGNWSGGIPGTSTADNAHLFGAEDNAIVATPFIVSQGVNVRIGQDASLTVIREMDMKGLFLGYWGDENGGKTYQQADINISGNLRIGHSPAVTSGSSFTVENGSLTVGDEIYIRDGVFEIEGAEPSISADSMQLLENAELKFDFEAKGASPVNLNGRFKIDSGAKLTIDLRGYTMGGNNVVLVNYDSIIGAFNTGDVEIIGLSGGSLTYGETSLTLNVSDEILPPVKSMWVTARPSADELGVEVNTGRIIRNLSSEFLTHTESVSGDDLIYSMSWAGSDFDGDGENDTVSFDLRVRGYSNSSFSYSETSGSSSASLGDSADVIVGNDFWGVGSDYDLDAGETLHFTISNVSSSAGNIEVEGFTGMTLGERGGHTHQLIFGRGNNLDSASSNNTVEHSFELTETATVTSAGNINTNGSAVSSVSFKITVGDPGDELAVDDLSAFSVGPQMANDYPNHTDFSNHPEFSWNTVPRWTESGGVLTASEAEAFAANASIISVGGFLPESEIAENCRLLKGARAGLKTLFYLNTSINFERQEADEFYNSSEWDSYTLINGDEREYDMIRTYKKYNHDYKEMSDWWVDLGVRMASNALIDGVFIDKADSSFNFYNDDGEIESPVSGDQRSYFELRAGAPSNSLLIGNTLRNERAGGSRGLMSILSGSYVERWELPSGDSPIPQSEAEARAVSVALMREAALKGKVLMPSLGDRLDNSFIRDEIAAGREEELIELIKERVTLPLAYFLIVAEEYSYFRYQPDQSVDFPEFIWNVDYVDELNRPLGAPLGAPVRKGYIYTRSYEYVDVVLDVEKNEADLTWYEPAVRAQLDLNDNDDDTVLDIGPFQRFHASLNTSANEIKLELPAETFDGITDEISIEVWAKGSIEGSYSDNIFNATDSLGQKVISIDLPWNNSRAYWDAGNQGSDFDRCYSKVIDSNLLANDWNHWVFVKNTNTERMEIYLNGNLIRTFKGRSKTITGITNITFGSEISTSSYSETMDRLAIYSVALTSSEINDLYNSYK